MKSYRNIAEPKTLSDWPILLLISAVCLFCWITGYVYSIGFPITQYSTLPLWAFFSSMLTNRAIAYLLGLFLLILTAFVIQRISDVEVLIRERTRLPFMFFLLLFSTNIGLMPIKEVSVVLICFVFALYQLFYSYQQPEVTGKFFNAGVLIGLSGLFMPQALWFMLLLWIGMYQFRSLSIKSFLASLVGMLIVYWFVLAWCIWDHNFSILDSMFSSLINFSFFPTEITFQYYHIGTVGFLLLLIMALFHVKIDALNNSVKVRQMLSFLSKMSVWSLMLIFLYGKDSNLFLAIFYVPSSILVANLIENIRYNLRALLFYFLLLLLFLSFAIQIWIF